MIVLKSKSELALMRDAGRINAEVLARIREAVKPGVTTGELDLLAERVQRELGASPVFRGYTLGSAPPFPSVITVSVNEELVHGIPGSRRLLAGDLVSIDCASNYKGYIGDSAFAVGVGEISDTAADLIDVVETALDIAIAQAVPGNRLGDLGAAVQAFVEGRGYNVVRGYGGHGVGRTMHESPHVPNHGRAGSGMKFRKNMTIAIEPMVLEGAYDVLTMPDQWTVVSKDGKLTAHCEHTVAIGDNGAEILTLL